MTIYRWQCGVSRIDIDDETSEYKFFLEDKPAQTDDDMLTIFETLVEDCYVDGSLFDPVVEEQKHRATITSDEFHKMMTGQWPPPERPPEMADAVSNAQGQEEWRCKYCDGQSRPSQWKKSGDACPKCGASPTFMGGL